MSQSLGDGERASGARLCDTHSVPSAKKERNTDTTTQGYTAQAHCTLVFLPHVRTVSLTVVFSCMLYMGLSSSLLRAAAHTDICWALTVTAAAVWSQVQLLRKEARPTQYHIMHGGGAFLCVNLERCAHRNNRIQNLTSGDSLESMPHVQLNKPVHAPPC